MLLFVGGLFIFHSESRRVVRCRARAVARGSPPVPAWNLPAWLACSSLTTFEMGKGPDELAYLSGTKDFDLPFSNVRTRCHALLFRPGRELCLTCWRGAMLQGLIGNLQSFCCIRDGFWGIFGRRWRPIRWKPPGCVAAAQCGPPVASRPRLTARSLPVWQAFRPRVGRRVRELLGEQVLELLLVLAPWRGGGSGYRTSTTLPKPRGGPCMHTAAA